MGSSTDIEAGSAARQNLAPFLMLRLATLRPKQWTKNAFVLAALVFSLTFLELDRLLVAVGAFAVFCAISSAGYIVNDIIDRDFDRHHPTKRLRPIASGAIRPREALTTAAALLFLGLGGALLLGPVFALLAFGFVAFNALYSMAFKHIPILDCLTIALGFTIRVVAGAVVIDVPFSVWFVLSASFLAFFLACSKREREHQVLGDASRRVLRDYNGQFIAEMTQAAMVMTMAIYTLFTFSSNHGTVLIATVPFVVYGLLRYRHQTLQGTADGDGPSDDVIADPWLVGTVLLWVLTFVSILWLF